MAKETGDGDFAPKVASTSRGRGAPANEARWKGEEP